MKSLNEVRILGNVTANPEIKETPNGTKVAAFSIATNRKWKDANGNEKEEVEFTAVVAWGSLAEIAEKYVLKGKPILVSGRLKTRNWEDQDGHKRYKTEVILDDLILLGSSGNSSEYPEGLPEATETKKSSKKQPSKIEESINIEDIPF